MDDELDDIVGAKSKLKIIRAMADAGNEPQSIHSISRKADISYSLAYRDVMLFKGAGFVVTEGDKYRLNMCHPLYAAVTGLFSGGIHADVSISNRQRKDIMRIMAEAKNHENAQVIVHHNADPDAVGSAVALALALRHMGIRVTVSAPLDVGLQARAVLEKYPFHVRDEVEKNPSIVFIVDSSSGEQVGELEFRTKPKVVLIDHHERGNLAKVADLDFVDTGAHSTAILVYRLIKVIGIPVLREAAPYILSGIVADTAFLRIADKNDIDAACELLNYVGLQEIFDVLTVKEDISERIAKLKVLRRTELFRVRDLIVAFSVAGSFESRAAVHIIKTGADVAFVFNLKKDEIRISARVRKYLGGDIDLVNVLKKAEHLIDGSVGGHAEAASANGRNPGCAERVKRMILAEFEKRAKSTAKLIR